MWLESSQLFFKFKRRSAFTTLFTAWTTRMAPASPPAHLIPPPAPAPPPPTSKKAKKRLAASSSFASAPAPTTKPSVGPENAFVFTYAGKVLSGDMTPEEVGMEDGDEMLAVEMWDLTEVEVDVAGNGGSGESEEFWGRLGEREKLMKHWGKDEAT